MDTKTIVMCVVALILGMLMANMLKSVCGCKSSVVEGQAGSCNISTSQSHCPPGTPGRKAYIALLTPLLPDASVQGTGEGIYTASGDDWRDQVRRGACEPCCGVVGVTLDDPDGTPCLDYLHYAHRVGCPQNDGITVPSFVKDAQSEQMVPYDMTCAEYIAAGVRDGCKNTDPQYKKNAGGPPNPLLPATRYSQQNP